MEQNIVVGIVGGTGVSELPGVEWGSDFVPTLTPFGSPSSPLRQGRMNGVRVVFLERHGPGHRFLPHEIPYEANFLALKEAGVTHVALVTACGALDPFLRPGDIAIPVQMVDATDDSPPRTLFGNGVVGHVAVADPFCERLRHLAEEAAKKAIGVKVRKAAANFVTIPGPRFSTRAESKIWRGKTMHIVGMTTAREIGLAREAELCCVAVAHVTDMDNPDAAVEGVTQHDVAAQLQKNILLLQVIIPKLVAAIGEDGGTSCQCQTALDSALITDPWHVPAGHWAASHPWLNRVRSLRAADRQ